MRPIIAGIILLFLISGFTFKTRAQTCNGSLGDPVINQDFGSGANPGNALSGATTNMAYDPSGCPNDGSYSISNSVGDCFQDAWHFLNQDHTGNPNGYMMVVNASVQPSIFFTQQTTVGQLCPNTNYFFAAYITNLDVPSTCSGIPILPNITFTIETTGGTVLQTYNTGDIKTTSNVNWQQYGTFFTTPANSTEAIVVKISNNAQGGCGNDFALDDITFRACGPVIQAGFGSATGSSEQAICAGSNAVYNLKADVLNDATPVYQWQQNLNGSGWTDIDGSTANTIQVPFTDAVSGVYQYRLGIANGSNISSAQCRVYSQPLTITVNPLPEVQAIPDQTICEGYTLQLTAIGGTTYTWTGPDMLPRAENPLIIKNITPANAGVYSVVAVSDKGCAAPPVSTNINVLPEVVATISADTTICAGQPVQLASDGGLYYKWTPSTGLNHDDIPNPIATPSQTTVYTVHVSNQGCTDSSRSVTVNVNQLPVADAGNNKTIFEGQSVKLNGAETGDNITAYYWTPATFLDNPRSLIPLATPPEDITYTLNVISSSCGSSSSTVFVRVYEKISVPNAFTPNNDGINDVWNIDKLVTYPESSVLVYNRYGQQVFKSTGYAKAWDGRYNGSPLPTGTYYYIINLKNDTPKVSGWVAIIR